MLPNDLKIAFDNASFRIMSEIKSLYDIINQKDREIEVLKTEIKKLKGDNA